MAAYEFNREPIDVPTVKTKFRRIDTKIPAPGTLEILNSLDVHESRSMHGQLPIVWKRAKNASVYDIADNKWIDFTSGIFVTNVGHSNDKVSAAISDVISGELYSCYAYPNEIRAKYLEKLLNFCDGPNLKKRFCYLRVQKRLKQPLNLCVCMVRKKINGLEVY